MADRKDYDVGYGKPPVHTRFQPGQSGNPKGRPKGSKNIKTDLMEELGERVLVSESGRKRAVSKQRAMVKSLMAKALNGDTRSVQVILQLIERLLMQEDKGTVESALSADDRAILDDYLNRQLVLGAASDGGDDDK